jgi:putative colanic acid biosynthesis UDP-glucose lipid carrier transferase
MAADFDRAAVLRTAANVIPFDYQRRPRSSPHRPPAPPDGNWLDGQVLKLNGEAAVRPAPVRLQALARALPADVEGGLNGRAKRVLDIVVAGAALLFLAPLLALIAMAVVVDSPGPVLFRQVRLGRGRRPFKILKFRTMRRDDGDLVMQAKAKDSRVTRIGSFLRRSSLDELPQLFNVLRGDMSIVGPRPHAVRHDFIFERHLKDYPLRFRSKPGIIGLAQLNGARGEIRSRRDITRRTKLDLLYQRRWSLLLDLRLICITPAQLILDVLKGRSY